MPELWRTSWRLRAAHLFDTAFRIVLPPVCVSCRQIGSLFCASCREALPWITQPVCEYCGLPRPEPYCVRCRLPAPLSQLRAAFWYSGPVVPAIHHLKYEGTYALAPPLAEMMATAWQQEPLLADVVVPVPLHPLRKRERGYNQAALLARHLSRHLALPFQEKAVRRTRATLPQVGLNNRQRQENVKEAFQSGVADVAGKEVLLIDDVCTTGATLGAAATALLVAGASSVRAFCLARAAGA